MDIKQEKKLLRSMIRVKKKTFSLEQKKQLSIPIFKRLENEDCFKNSNVVLLYWSMNDEVFTHDFVEQYYKQKTILLPCVEGDNLILRQYQGLSSMQEGEQFHILEPKGDEFTELDKIDIMIIPGVAFDKERNRMGRGRGFYDRLLTTVKKTKIAVGFDFQLVNKVPTENFDIKMDKIITTTYMY